MLLLLATSHNAHQYSTALRCGDWRGETHPGQTLQGKKLGIYGMGNIGKRVAIVANALGMHVQYYTRNPLAPEDNPTKAEYVPFERLLQTSDYLTLHLPLSDDTHHIIGSEQIKLMKKGVILINTARGAIIDEDALIEALQSGKIAAAGLDVYQNEPHINQTLLKLENTYLLPHTGTTTVEAIVS